MVHHVERCIKVKQNLNALFTIIQWNKDVIEHFDQDCLSAMAGFKAWLKGLTNFILTDMCL